jgi:transposase InsO family protein
MGMAYNINPQLPLVRMEAVRLVRSGMGIRSVARHLGYSHGAIRRWLAKADNQSPFALTIPTLSSRPNHHPNSLPDHIANSVLEYRRKYRRCAEVIQYMLTRDGIAISLSSVKRILKRNQMSRFSKWKKWHSYPPRPMAEKPGSLVEIDTIHDGMAGSQLYVYTMLDVCSRWAFAIPSLKVNTHRSLSFVEQARRISPFAFLNLQSDHGSEFSKWFTKRINERGVSHRHSRIRKPNDNAHLERFNRTIQDECISRIPRDILVWKKEIPEYLRYYNTERPHMALDMKTPINIINQVDTRY